MEEGEKAGRKALQVRERGRKWPSFLSSTWIDALGFLDILYETNRIIEINVVNQHFPLERRENMNIP